MEITSLSDEDLEDLLMDLWGRPWLDEKEVKTMVEADEEFARRQQNVSNSHN